MRILQPKPFANLSKTQIQTEASAYIVHADLASGINKLKGISEKN